MPIIGHDGSVWAQSSTFPQVLSLSKYFQIFFVLIFLLINPREQEIVVNGSEIPSPASSFEEIDLGESLNRNVKRSKYAKPTPIQRHAIPIALAVRDLMACAQTGSGKTTAFCFPIIHAILELNRFSEPGQVAFLLALILSPTRELACQIYEEAKKFAYQTQVRVAVAYARGISTNLR